MKHAPETWAGRGGQKPQAFVDPGSAEDTEQHIRIKTQRNGSSTAEKQAAAGIIKIIRTGAKQEEGKKNTKTQRKIQSQKQTNKKVQNTDPDGNVTYVFTFTLKTSHTAKKIRRRDLQLV